MKRRCSALLLMLAGQSVFRAAEPKKPNGPIFGSPAPIPGALRGLVYRLPKNTGALPNFSAFKPVGAVYTTRLDYPLQNYGDEWFGIEYTGRFYVTTPGDYFFQLTVDDDGAIIIAARQSSDRTSRRRKTANAPAQISGCPRRPPSGVAYRACSPIIRAFNSADLFFGTVSAVHSDPA
jgi:hypothetical protein